MYREERFGGEELPKEDAKVSSGPRKEKKKEKQTDTLSYVTCIG